MCLKLVYGIYHILLYADMFENAKDCGVCIDKTTYKHQIHARAYYTYRDTKINSHISNVSVCVYFICVYCCVCV